jgi:hypothetical protein
MLKRKYQPDERLDAFAEELNELCDSLFDKGGTDLAGHAILHLAQEAHMIISDLQKLKASSSPSFSAANWEAVAPDLGLRGDIDITLLDLFTLPIAILPPSVHRKLMKNAWQWINVFQEIPRHQQEESRKHLLEAVRTRHNLLSF